MGVSFVDLVIFSAMVACILGHMFGHGMRSGNIFNLVSLDTVLLLTRTSLYPNTS